MLVLFATIRSPTFVLRAVMMPGNGAVTRLNATCCSRTRTLAAKASALALVVSWLVAVLSASSSATTPWCHNFCQILVLFVLCPDVYHPAFEVSVDARKNTRFLPRPDLSRKHEAIGRRAG